MNTAQIKYIATSIILSIVTLLFYANFRSETILAAYLNSLQIEALSSIELPTLISNSSPSFLQAIILGFFLRLIWKKEELSSVKLCAFSLSISLFLEALQLTPLLPGYFDWLDVFSLIIAGALLYLSDQIQSPPKLVHNQTLKLLLSISLISGAYVTSIGSTENTPIPVTPITLTWEELRVDIQPVYGDETPLTRPGKIYKKDQNLYIVDQYRGIHIFDLSDQLNPMRIVYIPIIGALDISIKNEFAYINSFNDLVTINIQSILNNSFDPSQASRNEYVFNQHYYWDFIPYEYTLEGEPEKYADYVHMKYSYPPSPPKKGIIIGFYHPNGSQILFGEK